MLILSEISRNANIQHTTWTVGLFLQFLQEGKLKKDKYQRKKKWLIFRNENKRLASIVEFIDFLKQNGNTINAILLGTSNHTDEKGKARLEHSNIDGNNRMNAMSIFFREPLRIYPEILKNIEKHAKDGRHDDGSDDGKPLAIQTDPEAITTLIGLFKNMTVKDLTNFNMRDWFKRKGHEQFFKEYISENRDSWDDLLKQELNMFDTPWGGAGSYLDVKIEIMEVTGSTDDDLVDLYTKVNEYSTKVSHTDLLCAKMKWKVGHLIDKKYESLKTELVTAIREYYKKKSEGEELDCYQFGDSCDELSAFDFCVSLQSVMFKKCSCIFPNPNKDDNISCFLSLYEHLFGGNDSEHFNEDNINRFISDIYECASMFETIYKDISPPELTKACAKRRRPKLSYEYTKNQRLLLIAACIKNCREKLDKNINKNRLLTIIYYHTFYKKYEKELNKKSDNKKIGKTCKSPLPPSKLWTRGGHESTLRLRNWLKLDTIEGVRKEDMTKVLKKLIEISVNEKSNPVNNDNDSATLGRPKDKRRNRHDWEIVLIRNYYRKSVPVGLLERINKLWYEHIICYSTTTGDTEIDIERLGNVMPIEDKLNNARGNSHIRHYKIIEQDRGIEFMKYFDDIFPTGEKYDEITEHPLDDNGGRLNPVLKSKEKYDSFCNKNEELLVKYFIDWLYKPLEEYEEKKAEEENSKNLLLKAARAKETLNTTANTILNNGSN